MTTEALYEKHVKIRPRPVRGRFQRLRTSSLLSLLMIFYAVPFLQWGGRQAIWFDLVNRRFYIFSMNIWPQDFILLTFILLGLALCLFFATAMFGRIWCGYACPQTVYSEVFLWIEQKIEGNRSEQLRLARMSWKKPEKQIRRGLKYFVWLVVSLCTGIVFVGYFIPIRQLIVMVFTLKASFSAYFWIALYGGFCWLQAGLVREQFCKYICPYARFQGAMFDRDTLIIAYDKQRGEPRRRLKKSDRELSDKLGFCVDCMMCVQVCPTGIDIRNGLQQECIACAACVDACNNMMDQINAPHGLVRYTSTRALEEKGSTRRFRPKTIGYGSFFLLSIVGFIILIATRSQIELDVIPDRQVLSREISGERVQNIYTVKVINKTERQRRYILGVEGIDGALIENNEPIEIGAAGIYETVVSVDVPRAALSKLITSFYFTVIPEDNVREVTRKKSVFTGILRK